LQDNDILFRFAPALARLFNGGGQLLLGHRFPAVVTGRKVRW
jgi:hypothetical protein